MFMNKTSLNLNNNRYCDAANLASIFGVQFDSNKFCFSLVSSNLLERMSCKKIFEHLSNIHIIASHKSFTQLYTRVQQKNFISEIRSDFSFKTERNMLAKMNIFTKGPTYYIYEAQPGLNFTQCCLVIGLRILSSFTRLIQKFHFFKVIFHHNMKR